MDWQSSLMGLYHVHDEEVPDDGTEDFYGTSNDDDDAAAAAGADTKPGAAATTTNLNTSMLPSKHPDPVIPPPPNPVTTLAADEQRKAENQRKAELLRAKLIAQRQRTPVKGTSRFGTPLKTVSAPKQAAAVKSESGAMIASDNAPVNDAIGLESLLEEGRAAAAAAAKKTTPANVRADAQSDRQPAEATKTENKQAQEIGPTDLESCPTALTDSYYVDLPAWLDFTGYHNVAYRTAKLRTYKERRALEEEAKRINERLEKLRREEEAEMNTMRSQPAHPAHCAAGSPPPPLPTEMPSKEAEVVPALTSKLTNGIKRRHSPSTAERISRQRNETGFRIRGANDSPNTNVRPPASRHQSPKSVARRVSYPDVRRRSFDMMRPRDSPPRDPSLERRQTFYRSDIIREDLAGDERHGAYSSNRGYDQYYPRDHRDPREFPRSYSNNGRASSYSVSRPRYGYRGAAGLDLPKGGIRYFMIKSWNAENVMVAQREGIWSTQLKNEQMLTDAFHSSRHVILLFSVNKSMAFQGYAMMTSPPDPNLPKPSFCAKLNWDTSPAFTLRWLATSPVHFRMIGHLKNTLNVDEHGEARAVLVGKDGQEISSDAGMGVVFALDEAEANERDSA